MTHEKQALHSVTRFERMENLLVPVDFSPSTEVAIKTAETIARAYGSTVRLLHVAPPDPAFVHARSWPQEVRDELAKELRTEHLALRALSARLEKEDIATRAILSRGAIDDTILAIAQETETDLILLTSRHEGALAHLRSQGVIKGVLRKARCKVLVVPVE